MAREYARIMTAIWRNPEFRALSETQQRGYLFLVTQPDISAAGVLALRVRRWADMASSSSPDSLAQVLKELEAGRFIVVDWDVEELLIRSFIRWDGGFNNPKRRPVIVRDAEAVESARVRRALAAEFERCRLPPLALDALPDSPSGRASHDESMGYEEPSAPEPIQVVFPQVDSLSDSASHSDAASDGVVVTYLSSRDTTTHNPETVPPPAAHSAQPIIASWIDSCRSRPPKSVIGQTSKLIKELLEEGIAPAVVTAGVELWATKGLHPAVLPSVVNQLMNARPAAVRSHLQPTRTDEWQDLKQTGTDGRALFAITTGDPH